MREICKILCVESTEENLNIFEKHELWKGERNIRVRKMKTKLVSSNGERGAGL